MGAEADGILIQLVGEVLGIGRDPTWAGAFPGAVDVVDGREGTTLRADRDGWGHIRCALSADSPGSGSPRRIGVLPDPCSLRACQ